MRPTGFATISAGHQGILPRQFAQAAPVDRRRRQLGLAVRPAAHRHRQGPAQAGRRRHQTLLLQRRNPILMKKLIFSPPLAASAARPSRRRARAARAGRRRRRRRHRPHLPRMHRLPDRLRRQLQTQVSSAASTRQQTLTTPAADRRRRRSRRPIQALAGKQPDAALQQRVTGVPDQAAASANQELADRAAEPSSRSRPMSCSRSTPGSSPIIEQVMHAPRRQSSLVDDGSDARPAQAARHHQRSAGRAQPALPSVSVTPLPQQQQQQPAGPVSRAANQAQAPPSARWTSGG